MNASFDNFLNGEVDGVFLSENASAPLDCEREGMTINHNPLLALCTWDIPR